MNYNKILFKHFGAMSEDVLKIESLLRAGENEMAEHLTVIIPNYEGKMLEVFKEYYSCFAIFADDFNLTLREFFQYHFATTFDTLKEFSWRHRFKLHLNWLKIPNLEAPYYLTTLDTYGLDIRVVCVINIDDLQYLNTLCVVRNYQQDIWLPFLIPP